MTLNPQQQAALDAVKAHYPVDMIGGIRQPRINVHIRTVLDDLAAAICLPLDADVAAEIEALHGEVQPWNDQEAADGFITRTAAIFQRQSAQPGSVERV